MQYLTWRKLFELREKLNLTDEQLEEPVLFTIQDAYGDETAYPVQLLAESIHPSDGTRTLYLAPDGEELELGFPEPDEDAKEQLELALPPLDEDDKEQLDGEDGEDDDEENRRPLRKLPLGGLRLGFSEMDEDFEEATQWLSQPNPHTPPPAPGPAPLFVELEPSPTPLTGQ